jgi:hypothetical protein
MVKTETDEVVLQALEDARTEEQKSEEKKEESRPKNADQWLVNVRAALQDVLTPDKIQEMERVLALAAAAKEMQQAGKGTAGHEIREFFEELDVKEIEKLLKDLERLEAEAKPASRAAEEIVVYKKELEHVAREKEAREAREEVIRRQDLRGSGSLQKEVFEDFAKFLGGKDAQIRYEGNKFEVKMTSDGTYIITVPEASFENMVQVAQQLGSKDVFADKVGIEGLPEKLMDAALILERQAIFSTSAIESLYNAGYQLKRALDKSLEDKHFSFEDIAGAAKKLFAVMNPEQRAALQKRVDEIYLGVFLGKHDVSFTKDEKGIVHISREGKGKGKLYDVLFDRWQKSEEGGAWLEANGYTSPEKLLDAKNKEKIISAYDKWLTNPAREYDLMHRLKFFIEESMVLGGRFERRYGVLLNQWRHMLSNSEGIKQIKEEIGQEMGQIKLTEEDQLRVVTSFFQPEGKVEKLNYLPSEILKLFKENTATGERNEAACIIADSYVKTILQDRGFGVFTELVTTPTGGHTRLIAVSKTDGKAYYVDPNRPGQSIEIVTDVKLLQSLRGFKTVEGKQVVELSHGVLIQAQGSVIADSNALLTSGFLTNMIDEAATPLPEEARLAAAQRAASLFPENPIAWLQMAKYSTGDKQKEYLERAVGLGFDKTIAEKIISDKDSKIRIGAWPGAPVSPNAAITQVMNAADAMMGARTLVQLSPREIQTIDDMFAGLVANPIAAGLDAPAYNFIAQRRNELQTVIGSQPRPDDDRVSVFYLSMREQRELATMDKLGIEDFIESEIVKFSREINPGAFLPPSVTNEIQSRFRDLNTLLSARTPDTNLPEADKRDVLVFLKGINQMFEGAPRASGLIESGNPKYQEAAIENINQMDDEGGLNVLHTLSTFHKGRPVGLVSDIRREMRRIMMKNFEERGSSYIVHEQYRKIGGVVADKVIANAMLNIGPYAQFHFTTRPDPAGGPPIPLTVDQQRKIIAQQVNMDVKFAQLIFTITGEASGLYIRGRVPDGEFDPGATSFLNAEWGDTERYGVLTSQNKAVMKQQFKNAAELRLQSLIGFYEERLDPKENKSEPVPAADRHLYHETIERIRRILKNEDLMKVYIQENAVDLMAPPVQMWWENRFVRTLPMIRSLNAYEHALDPHRPLQQDTSNLGYSIPVGGDPEFGIMLRAFLYKDSITTLPGETERILRGKGADYYADVIFEPFVRLAGEGHTAEKAPGDARFIELFNSSAANFLNGLNPTYQEGKDTATRSDAYKTAVKRWDAFQTVLRPMMDAVRNQRINNPNGDPRQTNFALDDADVNTALTALGINDHAAFRNLISAMQQQIRDSMAHTLAFDPMFESIHYNPMTMIDAPMWMMDGKSLQGRDNEDPLRQKLGANNKLGRYIGDVAELGAKTRGGLIALLKANPNQPGKVFEIVEKMAEGIKNTRGNEAAHDVEIAALGEYFKMMIPGQPFDFLGLTMPGLARNSDYRKIMGKLVNSMSREEVFSLVESHIMPGLGDKYRKRLRRILKITAGRRKLREISQSILMLILSTIFQTTGSVMGVLNEGISQGAA